MRDDDRVLPGRLCLIHPRPFSERNRQRLCLAAEPTTRSDLVEIVGEISATLILGEGEKNLDMLLIWRRLFVLPRICAAPPAILSISILNRSSSAGRYCAASILRSTDCAAYRGLNGCLSSPLQTAQPNPFASRPFATAAPSRSRESTRTFPCKSSRKFNNVAPHPIELPPDMNPSDPRIWSTPLTWGRSRSRQVSLPRFLRHRARYEQPVDGKNVLRRSPAGHHHVSLPNSRSNSLPLRHATAVVARAIQNAMTVDELRAAGSTSSPSG
jgi:hypothetical protein